MSYIRVNDIFSELSEENKRLLNELMFANNCLKILIRFKTFIDLISDKLKTNLDSNDSQNFDDLRKEVEDVLNSNNRPKDCEEVVEQKPISNHFQEYNQSNDSFDTNPSIDGNETQLITSNPMNELISENKLGLNSKLKSILNRCKSRPKSSRSGKHFSDFEGCVRNLANKGDYESHVNRHKGIRPYVCDYKSCNKGFPSEGLKNSHKKICHLMTEKTFKCDINSCGKLFKTQSFLTIHKLTHTEGKPYKCHLPECEFRSHHKKGLLVHLKLKHSSERPYRCSIDGCGVAYKSNAVLQNHISSVHSKGEQFRCDLENCGKLYNTKRKLTKHQYQCHTNLILPCEWPGCDFTTKSKVLLDRHKRNIHLGHTKSPKIKIHLCYVEGCSRGFDKERDLECHVNGVHKGLKPFVCEYESCNKRFPSEYLLKKHKKNCHLFIQKTFECEFTSCGKLFRTKNLLDCHMVTHNTEKPFRCDVTGCQYKTHNQRCLSAHIKFKHGTKRPYHCTFEGCSSTFKRSAVLKHHISIAHTTQRPFACKEEDCAKTFKSLRYLKNHESRIHSERKPLFCDWPGCQFSSKNEWSLKFHKVFHQNLRLFACDWPECGKRFNTKATLKEHLKVHKCEKNYACSWPGCQYRCVFGGNLNKHMRVHQK